MVLNRTRGRRLILSVAYLWLEAEPLTKIRIISARKATQTEISQYEESP